MSTVGARALKPLQEEIKKLKTGGAEGDRTPDLGIANAALSQLSYCPMGQWREAYVGGGSVGCQDSGFLALQARGRYMFAVSSSQGPST